MIRFVRRPGRVVVSVLAGAVLLHAASCGAIIHPERIGQPHRNRLDTSVVLLDALGLLLFFVPGVVAFIVDFSTGAIYLPANEYGGTEPAERHGDFVVVRVDPKTLTRGRIEEVVSAATGRSVRLDAGGYDARALQRLEDFRAETEAIAAASRRSEVVFRAQSAR